MTGTITRRTALVALAATALAVLPAGSAAGHHRPEPHFRDVYCTNQTPRYPGDTNRISREDAQSYASVAIGDGYQWGGGCWNGNGVDDQPNDPPRNTSTGGEGGDCSGFVFKTWRLKKDTTKYGFRYRGILHHIHGPYTASRFKDRNGAPLRSVSKSAAWTMDAFASDGHVGMIWEPYGTPDGQDFIVEAKSESDGTGVWARTYRSNSNYKGVRRARWRPPADIDCGEFECTPYEVR